MFCFNLKLLSERSARLVILGCAVAFALAAPSLCQAQRSKGSLTTNTPEDGQPAYQEFRGVHIGMAADEARKKLGTPKDKSAAEDFYVFNDNENAQILYDKTGAVSTISVNFLNGASSIPTAKDVLGAEAEAKADGAVYKMVRYPKAGFWIAYSRTAGSDFMVTITIQKIQ
jgi:hypothetical protein